MREIKCKVVDKAPTMVISSSSYYGKATVGSSLEGLIMYANKFSYSHIMNTGCASPSCQLAKQAAEEGQIVFNPNISQWEIAKSPQVTVADPQPPVVYFTPIDDNIPF